MLVYLREVKWIMIRYKKCGLWCMTSSNLRASVAVCPHENSDPAFWKISTLGIVLKRPAFFDARKRLFTFTQKTKTGLEKMVSGSPGQVAYLPHGQGSQQVISKGLFTWKWGTPDRWGNMWQVRIIWTGGLPHLPGVPHRQVNRPKPSHSLRRTKSGPQQARCESCLAESKNKLEFKIFF